MCHPIQLVVASEVVRETDGKSIPRVCHGDGTEYSHAQQSEQIFNNSKNLQFASPIDIQIQ